jgi:hypothetical protein
MIGRRDREVPAGAAPLRPQPGDSVGKIDTARAKAGTPIDSPLIGIPAKHPGRQNMLVAENFARGPEAPRWRQHLVKHRRNVAG